jgi:membrane associated rhomboid family serine protease
MGIYDREYARREEPGFHVSAPRSATMQLVLITVAVYVVQIVAPRVTDYLALQADWYRRPWEAYQLLTYGFVHSLAERPGEPGVLHIIGNMFMLFLFGRDIEYRYGRDRFVAFYLSAIVASGLVWTISEALSGGRASAIGASGGATAVVILYALNFPHRTVYLYFAIPIPMWVFGLFIVCSDAFGAVGQYGQVAFTAHLGGAAFALMFYKTGWLPGLWLWSRLKALKPRQGPRLRVHEPEEPAEEDDLSRKVDEILQKIQDHGQDSLTWNERRLLEKASRR